MTRRQVTMNDVLTFFETTTGLIFYPDPSKWWRNDRLKRLIEMMERVIAEQARALGCAHVTAEQRRRAMLRETAAKQFDTVRRWASRPRIAKSLRAA